MVFSEDRSPLLGLERKAMRRHQKQSPRTQPPRDSKMCPTVQKARKTPLAQLRITEYCECHDQKSFFFLSSFEAYVCLLDLNRASACLCLTVYCCNQMRMTHGQPWTIWVANHWKIAVELGAGREVEKAKQRATDTKLLEKRYKQKQTYIMPLRKYAYINWNCSTKTLPPQILVFNVFHGLYSICTATIATHECEWQLKIKQRQHLVSQHQKPLTFPL